MYSNNIVNFQESVTILNECTKKVWKLIEYTTYIVRNSSRYKITTNRLKNNSSSLWWGARGVMVKAMDCRIVVSEFVLHSRYYVHFRANTLEKGMNPLILPAMG